MIYSDTNFVVHWTESETSVPVCQKDVSPFWVGQKNYTFVPRRRVGQLVKSMSKTVQSEKSSLNINQVYNSLHSVTKCLILGIETVVDKTLNF